MPSKRRIVETLKKQDLLALADYFELEVADRRVREHLVDAIASSKKARLPDLLGQLKRETLKESCRQLGLDDSGREKAVLVERLLGGSAETGRPAASPNNPGAPRQQASAKLPAGAQTTPPAGPKPVAPNAPPWGAPTTHSPDPRPPGSTRGTAMMQNLLPGTQVIVRGLQWEVVNVEPAGEEQRYRLRCVQGDLRGEEFDFLHPFEDITPVSTEIDPARAGRLQQWLLYHQAFLLEQALGPTALLAAQPGRLDLAPYQLVPVMRAIRMSRPRLLLADGVGLGKTVQAGLVLSELIARRRAHRILIVSPAGPLLNQWHGEMRTRFGLRFDVIKDAGQLQETRRELVLGANPFDHVGMCLTSIDFAKQEKVMQELERTTWDVVVIDEAHHCVSMGAAGDNEDSRRRRLAEVLARQADGFLLLTATPHDGYDPHFASLVQLLDPSLVDGRGNLRGDSQSEPYRNHVIRRLKDHIKDPTTGEPLFKKREVFPRPVLFSEKEHPRFSEYQRSILTLIAPRLKTAVRQRKYGDVLAFVSLLKRSVSTVSACKSTLETIRDRYAELLTKGAEEQETRKQRLRTLNDYRRRLERYGALSHEEEQDQAALEAEDMASEMYQSKPDELIEKIAASKREARRGRDKLKKTDQTFEALDVLVVLAEEATKEDPKLRAVLEEVFSIRKKEPSANILVYTEYTDSQDAVVAYFNQAAKAGRLDGEVLAICGEDSDADRTRATERFGREDNLVLVSTDATAEGLNLQERCHHLIHVELPYNPNRLEQRNGRIDRYGQKHIPMVSYLYLAGTFEERLLLRLIAKYERQRARLTFVPNTLGGLTSDQKGMVKLLEGLADEDLSLFKRPPTEIRMDQDEPDESEVKAYGELLAEVDRAISGFEKSAKTNAWMADLGMNAEKRLVDEASRALSDGEQLGNVDLTNFVCDALQSETRSSSSVTWHDKTTLSLELPSAWQFGLDDMPGYDSSSHVLRLTTDSKKTEDRDKRPLGYLGRAHPIVRRALDRVRNIQFGGTETFLDRRVSAVRSDNGVPSLLFTFLGTVQSGTGREYERLIAVRVDQKGHPQTFTEPAQWQPLASRDRQVPTKDVWKAHFKAWGMDRRPDAEKAATEAFAPLAESFLEQQRKEIGKERTELDKWLRGRADELCGKVVPQQEALFDGIEELARWKTLDEPLERLSLFATDGSNKPSQRREANGVVSLYRKRSDDLEKRSRLETLPPVLLGLLMLVPGGGN